MDRITYRMAETQDEQLEAFNLVRRQYRRNGIGGKPTFERRDDLQTIIAVRAQDNRIVGTVSIVDDLGPGSLPCEAVFPGDELPLILSDLREEGYRITETTCLASDDSNAKIGVGLSRASLHFQAAFPGYILITVSVRHAVWYQKCMSFEPLVQARYQAEHGRTDQILYLDLRDYDLFWQRLASNNPRSCRFYQNTSDILLPLMTCRLAG